MEPRQARTGYTLLELLVSMGCASILMSGLFGAIFVASKGTETSRTILGLRLSGIDALSQMHMDLEFATSFTEVTENVLEFTVPDRDGNSKPEVIRYSWSGVAGDPLTRQENSDPAVELVEDVHAFIHDIPAPPTNLLANGDMELGTASWVNNSSILTSSSTRLSGSLGLRIVDDLLLGLSDSGAEQAITSSISNGSSYDVGVWVKPQTASSSKEAWIEIYMYSSDGSKTIQTDPINLSLNDWVLLRRTLTTSWTGSLSYAEIRIMTDSANIVVDDAYMRIQQTEEQTAELQLQVGNDARSLSRAGIRFLNCPL